MLGCAGFSCVLWLGCPSAWSAESAGVDWQPWSGTVFQRAAAEHKLVLLDLEAVWCHWCHVMDGTTYADPRVRALIAKGYIAVRVDQDARPDLSNRYEDYGWPATVIFKCDGSELAKRRGYIPPMPMASMLEAFSKDPTPGPSVEAGAAAVAPAAEGALSGNQVAEMRRRLKEAYDSRLGGWGSGDKYLDWNALEYCMEGNRQMSGMARQTLTAGLKLVDPVWGGVDQYSVDGDWDHPHYEKIMQFQAESMRVFAIAGSLWQEKRWLDTGEKIHGYLRNFLMSPEGAFYTSQDADPKPGEQGDRYFAQDDKGRRAEGLPRVDQHIYARENGMAIAGLAALYAADGERGTLADALRAANWIIVNRSLPGGGFSHDKVDAGGPYLGDTLEMGRAFLELYKVTADREWLTRAQKAAAFIDARFHAPVGFATAANSALSGLPAQPEVDENVTLARFANLLARETGSDADRSIAEHAIRFLASPAVVKAEGYGVAGILLANGELAAEPEHVTVVGAKDDPAARALYAAALRGAPGYARLEWYDRREGPLPHADVEYPALPGAAAFLCANDACSSPVRNAKQLQEKLLAAAQ